jgi:hypothetical protein
VSITLAHGVIASEAIVGTTDEPGDVAGRNVLLAEQDDHRRRIELAMAAPRNEEKIVEWVSRFARCGAEVVGVIGAQIGFGGTSLFEGRRVIADDLVGELAHTITHVFWQRRVALFFTATEDVVRSVSVVADVNLVAHASLVGPSVSIGSLGLG